MFQDVLEGVITSEAAADGVRDGHLVALHGRRRSTLIGDGGLVKVNTSIGCSDAAAYDIERRKLAEVSAVGYRPDLMMDLSIVRAQTPLYVHMIDEFGGPVGTLPHYLCYSPRNGIDRSQLLEEIAAHAEAGVAWMTLHVAVTRDLWDRALASRSTPVTARGGGMVVADMNRRGTSVGVFHELLPDILSILARHGTALSLGTTFRPANVVDALDAVHRDEIALQGQYIDEAARAGVPVLLEAVGHMTLARAAAFASVVRQRNAYRLPVMTLGPTPTDAAVGEDHIASAIGGAFLAMAGGTNVLNSVTREEHTGGVPSVESILEGLRAARIAAHSVNISLYGIDAADRAVAHARGDAHTCVVDGGLFTESSKTRYSMGCTRCGSSCPLKVNYALKHGRLHPRRQTDSGELRTVRIRADGPSSAAT